MRIDGVPDDHCIGDKGERWTGKKDWFVRRMPASVTGVEGRLEKHNPVACPKHFQSEVPEGDRENWVRVAEVEWGA